MRVHLIRGRDERGATALLVAILSVVLIGTAAFAADFGIAFTSKRRLQTAADAGALAAAQVYTDDPGTCATMMADLTSRAEAQAAADAAVDPNREGGTGGTIDVQCGPNGVLEVSFSTEGSTEVLFGGILPNAPEEITTTRAATATVDSPPDADHVRPYMLCSTHVPIGAFPTPVVRLDFPGTGGAPSPCEKRSGNWWTIRCPEDTSSSTEELANNTRNGCESRISIVPDQTGRSGAALRTYLVSSCSELQGEEDCLRADTGNIRAAPVMSAFDSLFNKVVPVPIFCGGPPGECDEAAVTDPGGSNAWYPVHKIASIRVCGYHFGPSNNQTLAGACNTSLRATSGGSTVSYLLVRFTHLRVSGTVGGIGNCGLGQPCDGNLRRTTLTR